MQRISCLFSDVLVCVPNARGNNSTVSVLRSSIPCSVQDNDDVTNYLVNNLGIVIVASHHSLIHISYFKFQILSALVHTVTNQKPPNLYLVLLVPVMNNGLNILIEKDLRIIIF